MKDNPTEQIFDDLFRHLEVLETQSGAILQILKDRGVVDEQQFAAYLEKAAVASDVKWRAARVRMEHLLTSTPEPAKQPPTVETKELPKTEQPAEKSSKNDSENARKEKTEKTTSPESVQFNAPPDRPMTAEKSSGSKTKAETKSHLEKHVETSDEDSKKAASEAGHGTVKPAKHEEGAAPAEKTVESAASERQSKIEEKVSPDIKAKEPTVAPKNQNRPENKDAA